MLHTVHRAVHGYSILSQPFPKMITIEVTPEELLEMRFNVKRYSELHPNHPNEYFGKLRAGIIEKLTAAFVKYQETANEDYMPELND